MLQKISVIYTGGTIGMIKNPERGIRPFPFDNMYEYLPMLKRLKRLYILPKFPLIDSSTLSSILDQISKLIEFNMINMMVLLFYMEQTPCLILLLR